MQPARRSKAFTPAKPDSLVALADASSHLRNLQRRLSLVQASAAPLPVVSPLPARLDDRMGGACTRGRKSAMESHSIDRMSSEAYPVPAPPRVDFLPGNNSRLAGRDPTVVYA